MTKKMVNRHYAKSKVFKETNLIMNEIISSTKKRRVTTNLICLLPFYVFFCKWLKVDAFFEKRIENYFYLDHCKDWLYQKAHYNQIFLQNLQNFFALHKWLNCMWGNKKKSCWLVVGGTEAESILGPVGSQSGIFQGYIFLFGGSEWVPYGHRWLIFVFGSQMG